MLFFPLICKADTDSVTQTIATIAGQYGYDPQTALFLTWHESHWKPTALGDGHLICNLKKSPNFGKPIRSRGVWQINDCAHPEITDKQANDVEWSTHWAMQTIAKDGSCRQWSTCKLLGVDT